MAIEVCVTITGMTEDLIDGLAVQYETTTNEVARTLIAVGTMHFAEVSETLAYLKATR